MIHYIDDNTLKLDGNGGELLTEYGIIGVHLIKAMINVGITKEYAITKLYEVIETSIKVYQDGGEL